MRQAPAVLLASLVLGPAAVSAGPRSGVTTEAPVSSGREVLSPAVQAAPYQSLYGMADGHRYQFNLGAKVTVDDLPARPFLRDPSSRAAAVASESGSADRGPTNKEGTDRSAPSQEAPASAAPSGNRPVAPARRSLVDAPISPPLPAMHAPPPADIGPSALGGRIGQAMRAAPGEIGSTMLTPSGPAPKRFIDRLQQPAVFSPKDLPALTSEGAAAAGRADYGRRVLGEPGRLAVPVPQQSPAAAPQSYPLPVMVEVRLGAALPPQGPAAGRSGFLPDPAAKPARETAASPSAAVSRLQDAAGLFVDPSFPVLMSSPHRQTAFVRGWVNSEKLMVLTLDPQVVRVSVVGAAAPAPAERLLDVPVVLHLALPPGEGVASFIGRTVGGLEKQAGFKWRVARGYQLFRSATGGTVVLTGELPVSAVDRLLAYPDLLRVEPYVAPAETPAPAKPAPAKRQAPLVVKKAVDLTVLTTAYPWMGILVREIFFWIQVALFRA